MPLPPSVWQALPDREFVREIDAITGNGSAWRPITLAPAATYNALWSLVPPLACLLLAVQLGSGALARLVYLVLFIGALTVVWALFQMASVPGGAVYLYDVTNKSSPVGLFANRNHQAAFLACLIPMLAYVVQADRPRRMRRGARIVITLAAAGLGTFILMLIVVTGSRTGLLLGLISAASIFLFRQVPAEPMNRQSCAFLHGIKRGNIMAVGFAAVVAVLLLTAYVDRDLAVQRLVRTEPITEVRSEILPTVLGMIGNVFPVGAGQGSFEQLYLVHEPDSLLSPVYMNHVHDDWLEIVLEGGLPAMSMAILVLLWLIHAAVTFGRNSGDGKRTSYLGRLGIILVLLLALASLTDYPLRVPALACLMALAFAWVSRMKAEARSLASIARL
ncbi:O-antigen ligase family protein [Sphingobium baderi]|uniref:O-antigen ligase family protein n=1 Tax=Sphingobium baderi TaxID=1332080 RepID=UPI002B4124BE|nr:O-antigen ligase family protein [Sphingobium baderi]WRD78805.1 O-antigen ligase family protein [Sphingobium baderi]